MCGRACHRHLKAAGGAGPLWEQHQAHAVGYTAGRDSSKLLLPLWCPACTTQLLQKNIFRLLQVFHGQLCDCYTRGTQKVYLSMVILNTCSTRKWQQPEDYPLCSCNHAVCQFHDISGQIHVVRMLFRFLSRPQTKHVWHSLSFAMQKVKRSLQILPNHGLVPPHPLCQKTVSHTPRTWYSFPVNVGKTNARLRRPDWDSWVLPPSQVVEGNWEARSTHCSLMPQHNAPQSAWAQITALRLSEHKQRRCFFCHIDNTYWQVKKKKK